MAPEPVLESHIPDAGQQVVPQWGLPKRVLFRLAFCYLLLYSFPERGRVNVIDIVPGASYLTKGWTNLWHAICPWVAIHVFHLSGQPTTYFPTGSGDTTLQYIANLLYLVIAIAATLVWSVLDRKRPNYQRLHEWFRIWIRYVLAFTLFGYGFAKVYPLQFRPPGFAKLIEPYGDFSPMGVLWSFMGASKAYTIFSGACEVLGGLLLIPRRTATLGALVSFGVLLNVAMLNYCYDVPVKLYSTNLLLMSIFLAAPDLRRLFDLFVMNRATTPSTLTGPHFERRWLRVGAIALQVVVVGYFLYNQLHGGWQAYKQSYITPQRPPLYGLYEVETFSRNGQDVPPLLTDGTRWRKVVIQFPAGINVKTIDDRMVFLSKENFAFTSSQPDTDHVVLAGKLDGQALSVRLRKIDTSKMLLANRGFHWINEFPFNR